MLVAACGVASSTARDRARHRVCDRYAAPWGSDQHGRGTARSPFATIGWLDHRLWAGQTGCLLSGRYGSISSRQRLRNSGVRHARITIRAAPGASATVVGYILLEGAYTTISHLTIDGSNDLFTQHPAGVDCSSPASEPLNIVGPNDILEYDNYYQSVPSLRGNGIGVGFWGDADNTIIRYNRIHDVGSCQAYDHLIYLSHGNNVRIYDNWMWNDPHGRGIQLYPDPTNARIWGNVIDHVGVGVGIGSEPGTEPRGNEIFGNVVIDSVGLPWEGLPGEALNVYWGSGSVGADNSFQYNVSFRNPGGIGSPRGVAVAHNVTANPGFADAAQHDYTIASSHRNVLRVLGHAR
ncbi:MAG TPA: right-handed parallel beta-helix repeat-containing protein [Solirubrobacteraceae bacterium]|jgi:hypothetical protein